MLSFELMSATATTELQVTGMTCNNCARKVTEAVQKVPGVSSASVNVASSHASVRWNTGADRDVSALVAAISQAGFEAEECSAAAGESRQSHWEWNLMVGLGVTGVLMLGDWVFGLGLRPWFQWLAFALAGVVQIFCGAQFYTGAWRQLKVGQSNMDMLVALGSSTAFGYSTWALLSGAGGHVYFMEAAAIISLITFGHWLEARVSDKASSALKTLLNLAPETARKLVSNASRQSEVQAQPFNLRSLKFQSPPAAALPVATSEVEVPVSELQAGDRVVLRPGDRVPVDGVVLEGESSVDEAMLTGESLPVDKKSGSELYAGTVNANSRLVMRVTATGEATALAHIVAAVQRAQTSRADIQRLGDRVSNVFVPVIVVIALGAALWWGLSPESANRVHDYLAQFFWHAHLPTQAFATAFMIAAAVLIVACPCAMGLATPAAIMAAANAAARRGILIRDGVALEKAGKITAVIFDKTGTLTEGKPDVTETWQNGPEMPTTWFWSAALTQNSKHPISRAVLKYCEDKAGTRQTPSVAVTAWQEIQGSGVEAKLSLAGQPEMLARLGSLRWLRESNVDLSVAKNFIDEKSGQAATLVGLAADGKLLALFAVRDALKSHSAQVVARLQQQKYKTYLLTGDNRQTADAIARQAGIAAENVFAEVRPERKAEFVKTLQDRGERVAFVGDGINDAPALTQADLGIAVGRASDVAREAADIILLKSEIEAVPEALGLARATLRTIKQNLFWAFFYNALGVPLAALGFISPIFCAAAMGFSDLIVIGNALRLLRWRQRL